MLLIIVLTAFFLILVGVATVATATVIASPQQQNDTEIQPANRTGVAEGTAEENQSEPSPTTKR